VNFGAGPVVRRPPSAQCCQHAYDAGASDRGAGFNSTLAAEEVRTEMIMMTICAIAYVTVLMVILSKIYE
jgi:hypothetical protein